MKTSILICTRNGARTITETISAIGRQSGILPGNYEVIVVDNGSTDNTFVLAAQALAPLPCHHVLLKQPVPGKLNSLLLGVKTAAGSLISVIDDDNQVCEEFVSRTSAMFDDFPEIGMVGSANTLLAENVPEWFTYTSGKFGCSKPMFGDDLRKIDDFRWVSSFGAIAGAGSTFRKQPLLAALDRGFSFLNDTFRDTSMAVTGEDTELCQLFRHFGYKFGFDTRITVQHRIDPSRLDWPYARRLARSIGRGGLGIDAILMMGDDVESSFFGRLRTTWWWMAARRLKRLVKLLPAVIKAKVAGRIIDPIWLTWEGEYGALERVIRERRRIQPLLKERLHSDWQKLRLTSSGNCE